MSILYLGPHRLKAQVERVRGSGSAISLTLTLSYFSFFLRGFAALFTEPHPCRASSVMEQLGRVTLPAMELDDDRASPQADDSTTGHSTKSISSVSSTRHHLRAGLAQGIHPVSHIYPIRMQIR